MGLRKLQVLTCTCSTVSWIINSKAPSTYIQIFFNPQLFLSGYRAFIHWIQWAILIVFNPLSRAEKNKFTMNLITCGWWICSVYFRIWSEIMSSLLPCISLVSLEGILIHWMHVDRQIQFECATCTYMCGQGNFLNLVRKSCRLKNIRIHVDGA